MGLSLRNKTQELKARIDNYDDSYEVTVFDFVRYIPKFPKPPIVMNTTHDTV